MITAGIDAGARTVKAVLLREGQLVSCGIVASGVDRAAAAKEALGIALSKCGGSAEDIKTIIATGAGIDEIPFANRAVTEITCDAKGANRLFPMARTVIDVGAEEGRGIAVDGEGKVMDYVVNEKCGAGAGVFTETMARTLEVSLEDFVRLSARSQKTVPMNAQCAVFAESEVISLLHANTPKEDIAKAINDAIASRIASMVARLGVKPEVALIGGLAKNISFVKSLESHLKVRLLIPDEPVIVGALGAALIGMEGN